MLRRGLQLLQDVGIQALALPPGLRHDLTVYFGRYTHQKFPRERLLRIFSPGAAELQVVVHRIFKGLFQFFHGRTLKSNDLAW